MFVSFGYPFSNFNCSLVHQLYESNIIPSKKFILDLNHDKLNEKLYLGGIPSDVNENILNKSIVFSMPQGANFWSIKFQSFIFGNISYLRKEESGQIDLSIRNIVIDKQAFTFLTNGFFDKYYKNYSCGKASYFANEISCDEDIIQYMNFPNVSFQINDMMIELKKECLFSCGNTPDKKCRFNIKPSEQYQFTWKIGYSFFKDYVTVFDYEMKEVVLYEKKQMHIKTEMNLENTYILIKKQLMVINGGLLIVILLGLIKVKQCLNFLS